jgi:spermidine/putrescine transport system substrate-binding protein
MERLLDEFLQASISRRRLLHRAGAGALGLSFAGFLAACGGDGNGGSEAKVIPKGQISDQLNFSNWPYYIDTDREVLKDFKKKNGTTVKYTEEITGNVEFFGKVRQQYERGSSGGRDLHVVTDWLCSRMKILGYVQKLDKSEMPNVVRNIEPAVASPDFDPKREFSVPWQSGQVLLIFRKSKVGNLTSINDLFDPKLKGKVTMLTEMRDTVGSVLLGENIEPEKATLDQVMQAIEKVQKASKDGQIRRFTDNDYIRDILKGDAHVSLGWSGDGPQLTDSSKDVGFEQPKEGFMIFTDSAQIPVGAPHAFTAEKFLDFVYDPEIAAKLTASISYVPPVKGVKEVLQKKDPQVAESSLVFPDLSRAHNFKSFPLDEQLEIDAAFQEAIGV